MTESRLTDSQRVVVTGLGATTPLGGDVASTWSAMLAGQSGVKTLTEDWVDLLPVHIAAPVAVDPSEVLPRPLIKRSDRSGQFAIIASREAWADAGAPEVDPERIGVVIASGIGGVTTLLDAYDVLKEKGARRVLPMTVPMLMPNGPAALVGLELTARAGVHTPVSACSSGAEAIAYGADMIRNGRADIVPPAAPRRRSTCCRWRVSRRCRRCRPATTSPSGRPGPTTRVATGSCSARAPGCWCSRAWPMPRRAARPSTP